MANQKQTEFAQGEKAASARDLSGEGDWVPIIDWSSTHPGNRGVNREGRYECYEAPVGVKITIEEADKAGPILEPGNCSGPSCSPILYACSVFGDQWGLWRSQSFQRYESCPWFRVVPERGGNGPCPAASCRVGRAG